jgi:tetratricopeptide (TPR) repeat protein
MADDLRSAGPLFAYSTGLSGDDTQALAFLARESGGAHFTLTGEDQLEKTSKAHRQRPWQVLGVSIEGASDLILAGRPTSIFPGQTLLLVGRGQPADGAEIALKLSRAGEESVLKTRIASAVQSELAPRLYGQVAVGGLEELVPDTRDFAVAYARHFRITGATCSLLMLDTEEDYKRFNIKPEEDAFVVSSTPAGKVIDGAAAKADERRRDPRAAFVAWLERMERMPGTNFQVSPALRVAIQGLPDESFTVQPGELHCKLRLWSDLPAKFQDEGLAAQALSYDAVSAEAARRYQAAGADDALKAISSLVERNPGDTVLARDVAFSAMEWGRPDQAYALFRRVAAWRPYEPHSYHGLARSLTAMGNYDLALLYYELAVTAQWDGRFGDFQKIVGLDYLRFLRSLEQSQVKTSLSDFAKARRQSIEEKYGIGQPDIVVTMAWNTDGTDVDMHVVEPTGEECYYSHRQTRIGGDLSLDVTQGFGPEMYVLRKAVPGAYQVRAHYFASDANRASTRTRAFVTIVLDWGTKKETATTKTVTLSGSKDVHDVARIVVE